MSTFMVLLLSRQSNDNTNFFTVQNLTMTKMQFELHTMTRVGQISKNPYPCEFSANKKLTSELEFQHLGSELFDFEINKSKVA